VRLADDTLKVLERLDRLLRDALRGAFDGDWQKRSGELLREALKRGEK
jgi:hypothetical protein